MKAKTNQGLTGTRKTGIIVALMHRAASTAMQPGITTQKLDRIIENVILESGATSSLGGLYGFPAATCISINPVVVHGIPGDTALCDGDIASVDIGACYQGYHGDSAWTYGVDKLSEGDQRLVRVSEGSLYEGLKVIRAGGHLTDISHAIGEHVFMHGYSTPRDYAGRSIGTSIHEDPTVPNFGPAGHGILLQEGITLAMEPMVHAGKPQTRMLKDSRGVVARDSNKAAHFEHTIMVTNRGYEIFTTLNKEERPDNG